MYGPAFFTVNIQSFCSPTCPLRRPQRSRLRECEIQKFSQPGTPMWGLAAHRPRALWISMKWSWASAGYFRARPGVVRRRHSQPAWSAARARGVARRGAAHVSRRTGSRSSGAIARSAAARRAAMTGRGALAAEEAASHERCALSRTTTASGSEAECEGAGGRGAALVPCEGLTPLPPRGGRGLCPLRTGGDTQRTAVHVRQSPPRQETLYGQHRPCRGTLVGEGSHVWSISDRRRRVPTTRKAFSLCHARLLLLPPPPPKARCPGP